MSRTSKRLRLSYMEGDEAKVITEAAEPEDPVIVAVVEDVPVVEEKQVMEGEDDEVSPDTKELIHPAAAETASGVDEAANETRVQGAHVATPPQHCVQVTSGPWIPMHAADLESKGEDEEDSEDDSFLNESFGDFGKAQIAKKKEDEDVGIQIARGVMLHGKGYAINHLEKDGKGGYRLQARYAHIYGLAPVPLETARHQPDRPLVFTPGLAAPAVLKMDDHLHAQVPQPQMPTKPAPPPPGSSRGVLTRYNLAMRQYRIALAEFKRTHPHIATPTPSPSDTEKEDNARTDKVNHDWLKDKEGQQTAEPAVPVAGTSVTVPWSNDATRAPIQSPRAVAMARYGATPELSLDAATPKKPKSRCILRRVRTHTVYQ